MVVTILLQLSLELAERPAGVAGEGHEDKVVVCGQEDR
jgi:hypothetical protein